MCPWQRHGHICGKAYIVFLTDHDSVLILIVNLECQVSGFSSEHEYDTDLLYDTVYGT